MPHFTRLQICFGNYRLEGYYTTSCTFYYGKWRLSVVRTALLNKLTPVFPIIEIDHFLLFRNAPVAALTPLQLVEPMKIGAQGIFGTEIQTNSFAQALSVQNSPLDFSSR
jgi:hypothetical protein